jgi:diaminohydroxyphosphoribosylaminopyrimidine deaminase / 5-amino-6-(5-phosphoribosylamino)uracil reductase
MLNNLFLRKINILFVEGGAQTLQNFIDTGLWDEARVIRNSKLFLSNSGGVSAPHLKNFTLENEYQLGDNEITVYKNF